MTSVFGAILVSAATVVAGNATHAPSADAADSDPDLGVGERFRAEPDARRETPPEVTRELEWTDKEYMALPALHRLPDFLSVDALVALLPPGERDNFRDSLHAQLEGKAEGALLSTYVDDGERILVLWLAGNLTQVLAVFDGPRLASKRVIERGTPRIGEVLSESDGGRREILVELVTSMSVCCNPLSLEVWRVGPHGSLSRVLSFPRGHADIGPGVRWSFMNHFAFEDDRVVITRAYPVDGTRYELVFDRRRGRFEPTRDTARRLVKERRVETEDEGGAQVRRSEPFK